MEQVITRTAQHPSAVGLSARLGGTLTLAAVCIAFFFSGFPALVYQLVWQRVLFEIYGINVESVTVIVAAFMLGLGLGSLIGGRISKRPGVPLLFVFGIVELGIGAFGFASLGIFDWIGTVTLDLPGPLTGLVTFALVVVPTLLMGATLPILVAFLVNASGNVGRSVGILYFANTLGSATACFAGAIWLFHAFGQAGSVRFAVVINALVGTMAMGSHFALKRFSRRGWQPPGPPDRCPIPGTKAAAARSARPIRFRFALGFAALSGFVALSYEIVWFRIYSFTTGGLAASFALMLGAYLAGIALGSLGVRRFCRTSNGRDRPVDLTGLAVFVIAVNLTGFLAAPAVSAGVTVVRFTWTLPAIAVSAALLGSVFPLICHFGVQPDERTGQAVSYLYLANIIGSTAGTLVTGFVLMDVWPIKNIAVFLALFGLAGGVVVLFLAEHKKRALLASLIAFALAAAFVIATAGPLFDQIYERLMWRDKFDPDKRFAHVVETKSGVITVTDNARIFGGGVYDGKFNTDIHKDTNRIIRAFSISAWHPRPKTVLMIGLSSGSWAQVIAHHPLLEKLTTVEINAGYLRLIDKYPQTRSLLTNPKVDIVIDDGRRWLNRHKKARFDVIVMNTTYHWRAHNTNLLSVEFLELVRSHLKKGGVFFYNTTESKRVQRTAIEVYPYAVRFYNFMVVSDSPIALDKERWQEHLERYEIDGKPVFDPRNARHRRRLRDIVATVDTLSSKKGSRVKRFEPKKSLKRRTRGAEVITDDNMGDEWKRLARLK